MTVSAILPQSFVKIVRKNIKILAREIVLGAGTYPGAVAASDGRGEPADAPLRG